MGFNLGNIGNIMNQIKDGQVSELLQKLPLDKLPLDQLLEKLPLDQLLSSSFLEKFTSFSSIQDFLKSGGFSASSAEDIKALPKDQLDEHVNQNTSFSSLKDMLLKAVEYYTHKK